jgi:EmrB/QacA subfamily drug resistance transporter
MSERSGRTRDGGLPTFLIAGVATFMASLDNLVVTMALPTIRQELHTTLESLEWTVHAYTLTFAVFLLTAAILGDRFGRRTVFVGGVMLFTLASAAAALSRSPAMLVAARAAQGLGGSVIFPLALTLVIQAAAPRRRGAVIAGLSGMSGLAIALGPWVGGLVVEYGNWHWVFWINVPIGLVLVPLAVRWLRDSRGPYSRLDGRGTVLVTAGLLGIVYGLVRSTGLGWRDARVVPPIMAGVLLLAVFVSWERRASNPVLPPHLFASRGFRLSNLVAMLVQGGMFGAVFLLTQFLQDVLGYPPTAAGLRTLPWTVMPVLVVPVAALLAERVGVRPLMVAGTALQAGGLAWIALVASAAVPYPALLPALLLAGAGMGLFFALSARQTLEFVSTAEEGVASGVNNAMRQVGTVLGIAVLAGVFAGSGGEYHSAEAFVRGLRPALWVGTLALAGAVVATLLTPARAAGRGTEAVPAAEQAAELSPLPSTSS